MDGTVIQNGTYGTNCYCLKDITTRKSYYDNTTAKTTGVYVEADMKNLVTNGKLSAPFETAPTGKNNGYPILSWQREYNVY